MKTPRFLGVYFYLGIHCFFPYLLSRKNLECCPPELLLGASEGPFRKGFCFFLPFSANILMFCFFDLAENTRWLLNFFPNKFLSCLSCRCNKSASSLNISLDCCAGQLRAAKMLYLLKHVIAGLAQQEHCLFNICSNIIQINGYLLFFESTWLFHQHPQF